MTLGDMETTSRLHLAAHELVENVLRYGSSPQVGLEFAVEKGERGSVVRLSTTNKAEPEQLKVVSRCISALRAAPDPVAYYDKLIRTTAPLSGQSGLGLARIRAEAGLDVDFHVSGPEICIMVETILEETK